MPIIVNNATVSYQRHPAIHHVDVTFNEHEACAIFGPNGAGKSTLLKTIMGLLHCDTGEVVWAGLKRQDLAYLPQQCDVDRSQAMSVFELAAMGLWYEIGFFGGVSKAQQARVDEALEQVGMLAFKERGIAQLSNGQFQRVLFARMLVQDAQFLLLDEPFNAIDAKTTQDLLGVLQGCLARGKAVVAVLHDVAQVQDYFPRTVLIAREKIAEGPTHEVMQPEWLRKASHKMNHWQQDGSWCAVD
ncbi:MAG: metal ABC transporter ATP-binding protein [Neisseriaceae bacterium]|nr:metal ABC transporter ATP-binding protein [Neisseriaceae bacterium]MBP6863563.1 metal ABC transporter ATP-binding protein [Neisseriaceae bacterium]